MRSEDVLEVLYSLFLRHGNQMLQPFFRDRKWLQNPGSVNLIKYRFWVPCQKMSSKNMGGVQCSARCRSNADLGLSFLGAVLSHAGFSGFSGPDQPQAPSNHRKMRSSACSSCTWLCAKHNRNQPGSFIKKASPGANPTCASAIRVRADGTVSSIPPT